MERKEFNSLNEAALQVQLNESRPINQQQREVIRKHARTSIRVF